MAARHPLAALRQQERRQPLARRLASQQQHLFLRRHQFVGGDLEQALLHQREVIQQGAQRGPLEPAIAHVFDRLGAEGVGIGDREAEKLAGADEAGDLPPSVGQQLEQLGGAGGDVEEAGGRLALVDEALPGR